METMRSFLIPIVFSLSLGTHAAPPQRIEIQYEVTHNGTPLADVTVKVTDDKGTQTHIYQVAGRERLRVPAGEFNALKVVRKHDNPGKRATEIWFATDKSYIPLKIVLDRDGARSEQVAVRINTQ